MNRLDLCLTCNGSGTKLEQTLSGQIKFPRRKIGCSACGGGGFVFVKNPDLESEAKPLPTPVEVTEKEATAFLDAVTAQARACSLRARERSGG